MSITIKRLMMALDKIENKYIEVEIMTCSENKMIHEVDRVYLQRNKFFIRAKDET